MAGETDSFNYVLSVQDEMSGPLAAEAKSLQTLQAEVKNAEKAIRQLQGAQLKYREQGFKGIAANTGLEIAKIRHHVGGLKSELSERLPDTASAIGPAFSLGITPSLLLAQGIAAVAREAERAAVAIPEFIISAAQLRENVTLAYTAVKGTAEEGREAFEQVQRVASIVHFPAEKAHELARDLFLQGLTDTKIVTATIGAQAALIRTGQISGAEKLKSIIERSEASGHFDVRGLGAGKAGKEGSARALSGLGIDQKDLLADLAKRTGTDVATLKANLVAGKVDADTGIAAIVDAINKGSIGKAAKNQFGFEELSADVKNAFSEVAQDVNLTSFTQALTDIDSAVDNLTGKQGGLRSTFQAIVDGVAAGIEDVTLFGQDIELLVLDMQLATVGMGDLGHATLDVSKVFGGAVVDTMKAFEFIIVGLVEVVDQFATGIEELGAAFAFVFGSVALGDRNAAGFKKTIKDMNDELDARTRHRGRVEGELLGDAPATAPAAAADTGFAPSFKRPKVPGFAEGGTVPQPQSPDSVFVAARPGERIVPPDFDFRRGDSSERGDGGKSTSITIGDIYLGKEHESGEHLRPLFESMLADVLERVQLELGG